MTVHLTKRTANLLARLVSGFTLIEHRNFRFSDWRIEQSGKSGSREVVSSRANELRNAGFIEAIFDRSFIMSHSIYCESFRHSVTDAGRAWLAAHHAPPDAEAKVLAAAQAKEPPAIPATATQVDPAQIPEDRNRQAAGCDCEGLIRC
jgi:hypothetical protein